MVKKPEVLVEASCELSSGRPESDHFMVLPEDDPSGSKRRISDLNGCFSPNSSKSDECRLTGLVV